MTRLLAPDKACLEMEVRGRVYRQRGGDGPIVVDDPAHARLLKAAGATELCTGFAGSRGGFRCDGCGRLNHFRRCGRCGSDDSTREDRR